MTGEFEMIGRIDVPIFQVADVKQHNVHAIKWILEDHV